MSTTKLAADMNQKASIKKSWLRGGSLALVLLAVVLLTATVTRYVVAAADSPTQRTLPYRGSLKLNGVPIADGTRKMSFSLFQSEAPTLGETRAWGPEVQEV